MAYLKVYAVTTCTEYHRLVPGYKPKAATVITNINYLGTYSRYPDQSQLDFNLKQKQGLAAKDPVRQCSSSPSAFLHLRLGIGKSGGSENGSIGLWQPVHTTVVRYRTATLDALAPPLSHLAVLVA